MENSDECQFTNLFIACSDLLTPIIRNLGFKSIFQFSLSCKFLYEFMTRRDSTKNEFFPWLIPKFESLCREGNLYKIYRVPLFIGLVEYLGNYQFSQSNFLLEYDITPELRERKKELLIEIEKIQRIIFRSQFLAFPKQFKSSNNIFLFKSLYERKLTVEIHTKLKENEVIFLNDKNQSAVGEFERELINKKSDDIKELDGVLMKFITSNRKLLIRLISSTKFKSKDQPDSMLVSFVYISSISSYFLIFYCSLVLI